MVPSAGNNSIAFARKTSAPSAGGVFIGRGSTGAPVWQATLRRGPEGDGVDIPDGTGRHRTAQRGPRLRLHEVSRVEDIPMEFREEV
ncbi:hypothetical protein GCM10020219_093290 [Nonomuraea dietziae]